MQKTIKFTGRINLINSFEKMPKHPLKRLPMSDPPDKVRVDKKKGTKNVHYKLKRREGNRH
jgi:hypothetical protein